MGAALRISSSISILRLESAQNLSREGHGRNAEGDPRHRPGLEPVQPQRADSGDGQGRAQIPDHSRPGLGLLIGLKDLRRRHGPHRLSGSHPIAGRRASKIRIT